MVRCPFHLRKPTDPVPARTLKPGTVFRFYRDGEIYIITTTGYMRLCRSNGDSSPPYCFKHYRWEECPKGGYCEGQAQRVYGLLIAEVED
jgi:hypothetical protein